VNSKHPLRQENGGLNCRRYVGLPRYPIAEPFLCEKVSVSEKAVVSRHGENFQVAITRNTTFSVSQLFSASSD
jgi:hypothetical protein